MHMHRHTHRHNNACAQVGFSDPPLQIVTRDLTCKIIALNARGGILQTAISHWLQSSKVSYLYKDFDVHVFSAISCKHLRQAIYKDFDIHVLTIISTQPNVFTVNAAPNH